MHNQQVQATPNGAPDLHVGQQKKKNMKHLFIVSLAALLLHIAIAIATESEPWEFHLNQILRAHSIATYHHEYYLTVYLEDGASTNTIINELSKCLMKPGCGTNALPGLRNLRERDFCALAVADLAGTHVSFDRWTTTEEKEKRIHSLLSNLNQISRNEESREQQTRKLGADD